MSLQPLMEKLPYFDFGLCLQIKYNFYFLPLGYFAIVICFVFIYHSSLFSSPLQNWLLILITVGPDPKKRQQAVFGGAVEFSALMFSLNWIS